MAKKLTETTTRVPLVGSPTNRATAVDKDQRFVNCFPEVVANKITGTDRIYLQKRFGTEKYIQPSAAAGVGRGLFAWNGKVYSVIGNQLYENSTAKQTLATSTGSVGFVETTGVNQYLFLCDGTDGYVISTTGVVTKVTHAQFPTPHVTTPVFMDGYVFLLKTNGDIYNSQVEDPLTWDNSFFITPESFPDTCVAIARQNNQVVALSTSSVEFFYDAGIATGSPLAPTTQATLQFGCASVGSIAQDEGLIVFVSQSSVGGVFITAVEGFKPATISPEPINRILDAEGNGLQGSWGYLLRQNGHVFYVLNLPVNSRTLVYDIDEQSWSEWDWFNGTSQTMFPFSWRTVLDTRTFLLHVTNGWIYEAKETLYRDDGLATKVTIQTSRFDGDTTKLKFMSKLEVVGDRQVTSSPLTIQYSDDDYKTWSNARTVDLIDRPVLWRLGSFRRRSLLMKHEANTPLRLEAVEFDLDLGVH